MNASIYGFHIRIGLVLIAANLLQSTLAVSPQPRLYSIIPDATDHVAQPNQSSHNFAKVGDDDIVPYVLSIDEGDSVNVPTNSQSHLKILLNQAVPQDVNVSIQVHSGDSLIYFEQDGKNRTNITITFEANSFGDRNIFFRTKEIAGHAEVVCRIVRQPKGIIIDDSSAYISVNISKNSSLNLLISIVGWIYFVAWSMSFYFQVILNYQRKSVVGLNFDFLALNLLGFACYTIYNFSFMFSREVQQDYYARNAYSRVPVEANDLFFALHAFILTLITIIQCFIYERGEQRVSISSGVFVGLSSVVGAILYIVHLFDKLQVLDVILYLSYVKLFITIIKYTPQAYMNYKRKATTGWSIHNILLDFTGGFFSIMQMFLIAYNYDDWISIFGNFTKFGLGVVSMVFDLLFVTQHYFLYNQIGQLDVSVESIPSPIISETVRSIGNQQQQQQQPRENSNSNDSPSLSEG